MLQNLYPYIQGFHGLFRWLLLFLVLVAIVMAFSGWSGRKPAAPNLFRFGLVYVLAMDLELITGLLLYFGMSPAARGVFIAHGILMFFAVLCAHIGGALARKAPTDALRYRGAAIAWFLSLSLIFAAIPRH